MLVVTCPYQLLKCSGIFIHELVQLLLIGHPFYLLITISLSKICCCKQSQIVLYFNCKILKVSYHTSRLSFYNNRECCLKNTGLLLYHAFMKSLNQHYFIFGVLTDVHSHQPRFKSTSVNTII